MDANAITQVVSALLGGGIVGAILAAYRARAEKDSIVVASANQVLIMSQALAENLRKEIDANRKECHEEMEEIRRQCQLELKASEEECRILLGHRDAQIAALRRDVEELRKNSQRN